ncbi:MAG: iron dicitrate transport regulator FecR, partial [Chrysiogenales bacterium]
MRLSKSDILIPLIGITALAALGYLLYLDITRPGGPGGTELIGTIISKSNVAERKYSRDVIWADVHKDSDLYNYDTIRTADGSQVLIRLKNGTEITLN